MPTESLFPLIDIPPVDIFAFLFENKDRQFPDDKVIFADSETERSLNYSQIKTSCREFGLGLKANWEWQKGDVLGIFSPNSTDVPLVVWGTLWAGGIISPANPTYNVDELAYQLRDSGAKALATQKILLDTAIQAAAKAGIPVERIILLGDQRDDHGTFKHFSSIKNISGTSRFRRPNIDPQNDLAFLVYSSGTTGRPKGVMLTHTNIVANVLQGHAVEGQKLTWNGNADGKGDRVLGFLPFFHIYGLTCLLHAAMRNGWTLVVMPKFTIEQFCATIQNHSITFAFIVPPVVLLLGKHPCVGEYDLSSIRMMNSGAAPLTRELVESVYKRTKIPVKQGYGLSETAPTTHTQLWEHWDKYIGSVGPMLPNQTAKYMSATEEEVPIGKTGELWIKGPNIFKGYHNNEEATRNALTPDGFFKTGDIGHQDKIGNFYITDRVKELIKYKGFQVAPAELEGLLVSHPAIVDVAVIGVEYKSQATELPRAYIVLKDETQGNSQTAEEIEAWIRERVAQHKRLRGGVRFVSEIPKSASGKILRRILKEQAKQEQNEDLTANKAKL